MSAARTASAARICASAGSSSPALPRSPLVSRSTVTADPACERRLMVPPQLTVSSSGWANTSKTLLKRRISPRRTDLSVVKATPADQAPRMSAAATRTANVIAQESFQTVTALGGRSTGVLVAFHLLQRSISCLLERRLQMSDVIDLTMMMCSVSVQWRSQMRASPSPMRVVLRRSSRPGPPS